MACNATDSLNLFPALKSLEAFDLNRLLTALLAETFGYNIATDLNTLEALAKSYQQLDDTDRLRVIVATYLQHRGQSVESEIAKIPCLKCAEPAYLKSIITYLICANIPT